MNTGFLKTGMRRGLAFLAAAISSLACYGQIAIDLHTDRMAYLKYEPVKVEVTLCNNSGNTLVFADNGSRDYLRIVVETKEGLQLQPRVKVSNLAAGLSLGAGETRKVDLVLNDLYDLQKEGLYILRALVGHRRLEKDFRTEPVTIQVTAGLVVRSREFGMPGETPEAAIPMRKASLILTHEDKQDLYSLQIEDDRSVYGVLRLGPRISGAEPELDVDALGNVHVLFMMRPRLYSYRVYDGNGRVKQDRYYILDQTIPHLIRDNDVGRVTINGGRLGQEGVDFQLPASSAAPSPAPAETTPAAAAPAAPEPAPAAPGSAAKPAAGTAPAAGAPAAAKPARSWWPFSLFKRTPPPAPAKSEAAPAAEAPAPAAPAPATN